MKVNAAEHLHPSFISNFTEINYSSSSEIYIFYELVSFYTVKNNYSQLY